MSAMLGISARWRCWRWSWRVAGDLAEFAFDAEDVFVQHTAVKFKLAFAGPAQKSAAASLTF